MKKILACVIALVMLMGLCIPALAVHEVPSVTKDPAPQVVPVIDPDGKPAVGVIRDEEGDILDYVYTDCLIVTAVADALASTEIPDYARELLLDVYAKLTEGTMKLPYEKFNAGLDAAKMVIRDLFDATFLCVEHPDMLEPAGVVLEITFDIGVEADKDVYVMTYKNQDWNPIVSCVNNGDGTVTCLFDHLCPVSFSVEVDDEGPTEPSDPTDEPSEPTDEPTDAPTEKPGEDKPTESKPDGTTGGDSAETGDNVGYQLPIWGIIALVALAALIVLTVVYRRSMKKSGE